MNDLSSLFADEPEGPSHEVRYRQGQIVTFNQTTLQNTVMVGSTLLTDLPLLGVGEATLLVPGAVVGIHVVGDAVKQMYIAGRVVTPNTTDAANATALLNSQIYTNFVTSPSGDVCSSATYGDLANVGPQVNVPVGSSGRVLVIATAQIQWATGTGATVLGDGRFDVAFAGANVRTPNETVDPLVGVSTIQTFVNTGTNANIGVFSITTQAVFEGLNPGSTVITMKYRRSSSATVDPTFFRRTLTVFKL